MPKIDCSENNNETVLQNLTKDAHWFFVLFCFFSCYLISEKDECLGAVLCSASLSLMQELISASSVMYEMKAKFSLEKKMLFYPPLSSQ